MRNYDERLAVSGLNKFIITTEIRGLILKNHPDLKGITLSINSIISSMITEIITQKRYDELEVIYDAKRNNNSNNKH